MEFGFFLEGFANSLTLTNLGFGLLGAILGTMVGILPGIGPALAIALLFPITIGLEPTSALIMFCAIYYGAMFGGSTTSILLNTPGESGSVMTAIEGNRMAKAGKAGAALATAAIGSFIAGSIGTGILALAAPAIADLGLRMTPPDFFALMILAFVTVSSLLGKSISRGLISLTVGVVIGMVGVDPNSGAPRLSFGVPEAMEGFQTVIVIVSLFAVAEALYIALSGRLVDGKVSKLIGSARMTKSEWGRSWKPWLRGTAIGFPTGVLPAGGSEIPTFLSYTLEKKLSKNKGEFGKGAIEGVAGPEAANNANASGALVPLLALGIPTSGTAAVMLATFDQFRINAGPMLFTEEPLLVWTLIASLFIANFLLLIINLPLIKMWIQILRVPGPYLFAGILVFAMIGAYSIKYSTFDLFVAIGIGALGVAMRRFGYPITPLILGAILGPMAETQFRRSMQLSQGDGSIFISTPTTLVMYSLMIIALSWPWIWKFVKPMISEKENKAKTSKAK
jgi:putative tricarboxylic transport membrane protein